MKKKMENPLANRRASNWKHVWMLFVFFVYSSTHVEWNEEKKWRRIKIRDDFTYRFALRKNTLIRCHSVAEILLFALSFVSSPHPSQPAPRVCASVLFCFALWEEHQYFFPVEEPPETICNSAWGLFFLSIYLLRTALFIGARSHVCCLQFNQQPNRESFRHIIQCPHISNKKCYFFLLFFHFMISCCWLPGSNSSDRFFHHRTCGAQQSDEAQCEKKWKYGHKP